MKLTFCLVLLLALNGKLCLP